MENVNNPVTKRIQSIDALRGFDMFWIMGGGGIFIGLASLTNWPIFQWCATQFTHVPWHGFHFYDMIFPLFLFIAGISFPFSLAKREAMHSSRKSIYAHIFYRGLILVLLGILYNEGLRFNFSGIRYSSVLGRIGLAWMFAAIIFMNTRLSFRILWFWVLVIGYWLLLLAFPGHNADGVADAFSREGNLAGVLDRLILPGRLSFGDYEPQGLLTTILAIGIPLIGMLTGEFLMSGFLENKPMKKLLYLVLVGIGFVVIGLLWDIVFPIIKNLWSSSFICFVSGLSLLFFSLFYLIIDIWQYKKWAFFFVVIGMNPITIYLAERIINFKSATKFFFSGIQLKYDPETGNIGSFKRFLTRFYPSLCLFANKYLNDKETAEYTVHYDFVHTPGLTKFLITLYCYFSAIHSQHQGKQYYMSNSSSCMFIIAFLMAILIYPGEANAQKKLSVFSTYQQGDVVWMKYTDNSNALYHHIASLAQNCLTEREKTVSKLKSAEDWNSYKNTLRGKCFPNLNTFIKTPLNAKVTGELNRSNYKVEKIIFESVPGFYVTGCMFIPTEGKKPFPAVLVAIGHSQAAFRRDLYQQNILNLVSKGFIVFTYDPLGQGERVQYYDKAKNKSSVGGSVFEHSYAGAQSLLIGNSISDNFIWDGVRALDFLLSRPEVDPKRLGMTGISGGGTQTAFLSAYDKRIYAAAPEAYITGFQRLFESIGPQDAEQNMYHSLKLGIDHADLLSMRAPKPTMVISTTQDFFSIQGARETVEKVKDVFQVYGKPGNITMVEANGEHGSQKENREKMYSFFREHLNLPGSIKDEEVEYFSEKDLTVTSSGQVSTEYNSKTVFDLNSEKAIRVINSRSTKTAPDLIKNRASLTEKIREISAYDSTRSILSVVFTGKVEAENYKIEKYFIQGKDFDYPIPFVLIKPYTEEKRKLLLYLTAAGKDGLLENQAEIEKYINLGYNILSPDLIGTGELKNTSFKGDSYMSFSYNIWFAANLVGQSIPGIQASDLDVLFKAIKNRKDIDPENITSVVKDEICSSYLHFAVFNKQIKKSILINPLISYEELIFNRNYDPKYIWTAVPGALQFYDLPYLEALFAPRDLIIFDPVTAKGETAGSELINNQCLILRETYNIQKAADHLKILQQSTSDFTEFLK